MSIHRPPLTGNHRRPPSPGICLRSRWRSCRRTGTRRSPSCSSTATPAPPCPGRRCFTFRDICIDRYPHARPPCRAALTPAPTFQVKAISFGAKLLLAGTAVEGAPDPEGGGRALHLKHNQTAFCPCRGYSWGFYEYFRTFVVEWRDALKSHSPFPPLAIVSTDSIVFDFNFFIFISPPFFSSTPNRRLTGVMRSGEGRGYPPPPPPSPPLRPCRVHRSEAADHLPRPPAGQTRPGRGRQAMGAPPTLPSIPSSRWHKPHPSFRPNVSAFFFSGQVDDWVWRSNPESYLISAVSCCESIMIPTGGCNFRDGM